jgi:hypothetical protein
LSSILYKPEAKFPITIQQHSRSCFRTCTFCDYKAAIHQFTEKKNRYTFDIKTPDRSVGAILSNRNFKKIWCTIPEDTILVDLGSAGQRAATNGLSFKTVMII